jgi:hypothetical protein
MSPAAWPTASRAPYPACPGPPAALLVRRQQVPRRSKSGPDYNMHAAGSHAMASPPVTVRNWHSVFPAESGAALKTAARVWARHPDDPDLESWHRSRDGSSLSLAMGAGAAGKAG